MAIRVKDSSGTTTEQTNKPKVVLKVWSNTSAPPSGTPVETAYDYRDNKTCSVVGSYCDFDDGWDHYYYICTNKTFTLDTVKVKDASGTYTVYPHQVLVKFESLGHTYETSLTGGAGDTMSIPTAFTTAPSGYRIVSYHETIYKVPSPQNKIVALPTIFPSQDRTYLRYIKGQNVSAEPYCVEVRITPEGYREIDIYNNDNSSGIIYYRTYGSTSSYTSRTVNLGDKTTVYILEGQSVQTYFVRQGGYTSSAAITY